MTVQPKGRAALRPSFATLAQQLKVLGDPTRLAIVTLLARKEYCVCDLMAALHLPQSTCSHHLGVLLVREGRGLTGRAARNERMRAGLDLHLDERR